MKTGLEEVPTPAPPALSSVNGTEMELHQESQPRSQPHPWLYVEIGHGDQRRPSGREAHKMNRTGDGGLLESRSGSSPPWTSLSQPEPAGAEGGGRSAREELPRPARDARAPTSALVLPVSRASALRGPAGSLPIPRRRRPDAPPPPPLNSASSDPRRNSGQGSRSHFLPRGPRRGEVRSDPRPNRRERLEQFPRRSRIGKVTLLWGGSSQTPGVRLVIVTGRGLSFVPTPTPATT